ncbi:hypothetical protein GXP70_18110 [Paenibacillus lycopersici]|uniref:Uncharacterized protein n=1 Tax=Paenibacillus lycopersici TaxID=2704462 RepID=A0A6C0G358_9BACL|nr:hypothetical protein [Paenibacillus lycopersici]QHT61699.1 hypothetical protein GXP70_18110 [Paenibacillus lycopersici]
MAQYDVHDIERRLREIDPKIIRIDFDHRRALHRIIAVDRLGDEYTAWTVPLGELDARQEREAYRINPERYNAFDELRAAEAAKQRRQDAKVTDMATDMAENLISSFSHKPSRSIA